MTANAAIAPVTVSSAEAFYDVSFDDYVLLHNAEGFWLCYENEYGHWFAVRCPTEDDITPGEDTVHPVGPVRLSSLTFPAVVGNARGLLLGA